MKLRCPINWSQSHHDAILHLYSAKNYFGFFFLRVEIVTFLHLFALTPLPPPPPLPEHPSHGINAGGRDGVGEAVNSTLDVWSMRRGRYPGVLTAGSETNQIWINLPVL